MFLLTTTTGIYYQLHYCYLYISCIIAVRAREFSRLSRYHKDKRVKTSWVCFFTYITKKGFLKVLKGVRAHKYILWFYPLEEKIVKSTLTRRLFLISRNNALSNRYYFSKKGKLFLNRHSILGYQTSYPIQKLLQQNTLSYILRLIEIKWEKTVNYQFNCNPDIVLSVAFF